MVNSSWCWVVLVMGVALGCGGTASTGPDLPKGAQETAVANGDDGDDSSGLSQTAPSALQALATDTSFFRVEVVATAGGARFAAIERLTLPAGAYRPPTRLAGQYALVAYAGDTVRDVQLIGYQPEERSIVHQGAMPTLVTNEVSEHRAILYVAADAVSRIELRDAQGVLATRGAEELAAAMPLWPSDGRYALAGENAPTSVPGAPQMRLYGPGDEDRLPPTFRTGWANGFGEQTFVELVEPTAAHLAVMRRAVELMTPSTRASLNGMGVVRLKRDGETTSPQSGCPSTAGGGTPRITAGHFDGVFLFNEWQIDNHPNDAPNSAVHEAAHALDSALRVAAGSPSSFDRWPAPIKERLGQMKRDYYMGFDFRQSWVALHYSAVEQKLASPYTTTPFENGKPGPSYCSDDDAVRGGFISRYAATYHFEDIADYGSIPQVRGNSLLCTRLQEHQGDEFPVKYAVHYAKLAYLHSLGFIDDDAFAWCTGKVKIGKKIGLHLERGDGKGLSFTKQLKAGFIGSKDKYSYVVSAVSDDGRYGAALQVRVGRARPPVGVHPIKGVYTNENTFVLQPMQKGIAPRAAKSGLALIVEANKEHTHGALFFVRMANAFGITTSVLPYAPFYVEQ